MHIYNILVTCHEVFKMKLPRGNSNSVDAIAIEVANKYGAKMLNKVTKTNMTNFKRIKDLI